jgi:CDP-2,3-bis-(O-geranylgeranyl)-sn-glycerol synthase
MLHVTVVQGLWLILPAYASNVLATLVGGGPPIDGDRDWSDGRRMLGDGKTWRGLILAPLLAVLVGAGQHAYAEAFGFGVTDFGASPYYLFHVYALAVGALLGDMGASFVKRRLGRERGERWLGPDQYDFIAGSLGLALLVSLVTALATGSVWLLAALAWGPFLVILILTPGLHLIVNGIGYLIGVKEVPW